MHVKDRFLKYVAIDTTSDPDSGTFPSTPSQLSFADMLAEEMRAMGLQDVCSDKNGYVYGTIPSTIADYDGCTLGFIAHMDTANDAPGADIRPRVVEAYDGKDIVLNEEMQMIMRPDEFEALRALEGKTLIVTDGRTLLGGDDKAGLAEILTAAEYLMEHPEIGHGPIRIAFTPDEEIGCGADRFDVKLFGADFAYTMDGGAAGELEYENFNAASADITFTGTSIHPGSAKGKMVNAALIAMEYQQMLPSFMRPECTDGYEGFIHLIDMDGCVEHACLKYIIRDHDMKLFEEKKALVTRAADYLNAKYGAGTVSADVRDSYFNMKEKIEPHRCLIDNVLKVYDRLGITPHIQPIRGGTDGARLSFMGLPCPNLGTGDYNCHGRFEFTCVESMEQCVQVIVELAQEFAEQN